MYGSDQEQKEASTKPRTVSYQARPHSHTSNTRVRFGSKSPMSQQPSITQGKNVATLGDGTKANNSHDQFSGAGKGLDEAREDRTQDEEFESQHPKEQVKRARNRKIRHLRTADKRPRFDERPDEFHDNAFGSDEGDTDGDDNQDARPNAEANPARDRSMDKELNELIPRYLDPRCSELDWERLGKSIDTKAEEMGDAGRNIGFSLMQANSKEARKCAEYYWAKVFTEAEAISKLENIWKRMIYFNFVTKNPQSWAILKPKELLECTRPYNEENQPSDSMDWEANPKKSGIDKAGSIASTSTISWSRTGRAEKQSH